MAQSLERLNEVDVVRGAALGGMLLVNLGAFRGASQPPLIYQSGIDYLASLLVQLLAEGKFYPVFAFLFGWGIARRQAQAADSRQFLIHNLRRMAILAAFGLLHAVLLWQGDILFVYALLGMLLPLLRRLPARGMAVLCAAFLLVSAFLAMPGPGASLHASYAGWISPALSSWLGVPGRSPWAAASPVHDHLVQFTWKLAYFPDWLGNFAACILAGYAFGSGTIRSKPSLRGILLLALPFNLFYALTGAYPYVLPAEWAGFLRTLALSLGGPLLGMAYALGLVRMYYTARGCAALEPLRKIGRMPLTTYLSQTLIGTLLFPWLRSGTFSPALVWPLAGAVFFAQCLFASFWLQRLPQGPMEWAWRRLCGFGFTQGSPRAAQPQ